MTPEQYFKNARPMCGPIERRPNSHDSSSLYIKCSTCGAYVCFYEGAPYYWQSDDRGFEDDCATWPKCWTEQFCADGQSASWDEVPQ